MRLASEERSIVTNKVDMRVVCFFKYCSAECVRKGDWIVCQEWNVGNQEIYIDAKGKHFL